MRKLMSLALALIMTLALAAPATAATDDIWSTGNTNCQNCGKSYPGQ